MKKENLSISKSFAGFTYLKLAAVILLIMAFALTILALKVSAQPYDFGDAPDPNYTTKPVEGQLAWAKDAPGSNGYGITLDANGNTYVTGGGISISKYNSDGTLVWSKSSGATGSGIAVDDSGYIYITGSYLTSATFGAGEANETTLSGAELEIFVAKYNNDGTLAWAKDAGGSYYDSGNGIAVDNNGNIYITGSYRGSATFGEGEAGQTTLNALSTASFDEIFVAKYNSNGTLAWAKDAGGSSGDVGYGIAVDASGNAYVTGNFYYIAIFGEGEAGETRLSGNALQVFVAKYNTNGTLAWAKDAGGHDHDSGYAIAVDDSGYIYVTGSYYIAARFGAGESNGVLLSGTIYEIFVAKYNNDGTFAWAKSAGGSIQDEGYGIAADSGGNVYVTGYYGNSAVFGAGEANQTTLSGAVYEIFVAKYNSDGTLGWARDAGSGSSDFGYAIAADDNGNSYVTGYYSGSAIFGEGEPGEATLSGQGAYIAKYEAVSTTHLLDGFTYLGSCVDSEAVSQPNPEADGDDANIGITSTGTCADPGDDEDGVIFGTLSAGNNASVDVIASTAGNLSAWIDWNADGDWNDVNEQIFADQVLSPGTNNLNVSVPAGAVSGDTFSRFRFSTDTALKYMGEATDGEVEDYKVTIPGLTVTIDKGSISESGGTSSATVTRNTGTSGNLAVTLSSDDTSEATVPASVDILDGNDSAMFMITAVDDTILDGPQPVTITATAAGYVEGTDAILVSDYEEDDFGDAPDPSYPTLNIDTGDLTWAKSAGVSPSSAGGYAIEADGSGNIYVTGSFQGTATFGAGEINETTLSGTHYEIFVAKYYNDGALAWAKGAGGPSSGTYDYDYGNDIALDNMGNIYVVGSYANSATFGAGEANQITLSGTDVEIFVAKYNNDGTLVWAKDAGGSYFDSGYGIAVDVSGYIYVTGYYFSSATFGEGEANQTGLSGAGHEIFVAKYNNNGTLVWAKDAGGSNTDIGYGMAVDDSGYIYITGSYIISATFGAGEANQTVLSGASSEIFLAKYNSGGTLVWAKDAGGSSSDIGSKIALDVSGYIYITGYYDTSATFGAGETNQVTLSGASYEIFVAKYNSNGTLAWAKDAGGTSIDYGFGIAADSGGNAYVTGYYVNSAVFGAGEANQATLSGSGSEIFVVKYNNDGTLAWAKDTGGSSSDGGNGITVDGSSNVYVTGQVYSASAIFGEGEAGETTLYGQGVYVAKYGPNSTSHHIDGVTYLGSCVDGESAGQPEAGSMGDDNTSGIITAGSCAVAGDDEDGVTFGTLAQGASASVEVAASTGGYLSAWIDWNADGDWDDTDEQVFADQPLVGGTNNLAINVPVTATLGDTFARFRFSTDTGLGYIGTANNGEIEDYKVTVIFLPPLSLTIDQASMSENGGTSTATVTRNNGTSGNLTVNLSSNDTSEVTVPPIVTINDGSSSAAFTLTAQDDSIVDGTKTVTVTGSSPGYLDGTDTIDVTDDDTLTLTLTINPATISETDGQAAATGTITRNTEDVSGALTVNLSSDDTSEVTVPPSVDIPATQPSVTFEIVSVHDVLVDGTQTATITASAAGYTDGTDTVDVTDDDTTTLNINTLTNAAPEGSQLQYEAKIDTLTEFDVLVDYTIAGDGTNQADGTDFSGGSTGQVTISEGSTSSPIDLNILEDSVEEFEEGLTITLSVNGATTGSVSTGTLIAGGTITNLTPEKSAGSMPADTEAGVSAMQKLAWMPGVDHENDSLTYDVYLDTNPVPAAQVAAGLTDNFYQPVLMPYNTTHYWRIDITDYAGNVTTGDVWSFTTQTSTEAECPGLGILCNPSFEFGTNSWVPFGDTNMIASTDAYDGMGSISSEQLRTSAQNPRWAGFSQSNVTGFTAGETYNLQLHAKGTDITQGHVKVKWYDPGSSLITTTYPLTGISGTLSDWTWYNRVFTVPNDAVTAEFIIWHGVTVTPQNFAGSTLMVDKIIWKSATEYCSTICNENFEAGLLFWTQQGKAGSNTVEIGGAKDGTRSVRSEQLYTGSDPVQWTGIRQTAEVTEGQQYRLRMWFKTENAESGHVRLAWKDAQGTTLSTIYPITGLTGTVGTWFKKETTVTPPANATKAEIIIIHGVTQTVTPQNFAGSTIWVDNLTMICDTLCNGGFETGMSDWVINGYKDVDIETTDVQEGVNAVELLQDATSADNTQ